MAFQKSVTLPSGVSGNYHRIHALRWDPVVKEFQCAVALYKDAATAADATKAPLVPEFARFRLSGASFDTYVGKAVLAAANEDIIALVYDAIKAVCDDWEEGATNMAAYLKCDSGGDFYSTATDI